MISNDKLINKIIFKVEYYPSLLEPLVKAKYELFTLDNEPLSNKPSYKDQISLDNTLKVTMNFFRFSLNFFLFKLIFLGGAGQGQLTRVGEKQGFELGRRIKKKYVDKLRFLAPDYNENDI